MARTGLVKVTSTLTLDGARHVADAAVAHARAAEVPVCVAVTGTDGRLLAFARMDGAPLLSIDLAQDKAYTVCSFGGLPTHRWFSLIKDDPSLLHGIVKTHRLIVFGGGVAVRVAGEFVGAVGVSGGSAEQDRQCAEAGAAAVLG